MSLKGRKIHANWLFEQLKKTEYIVSYSIYVQSRQMNYINQNIPRLFSEFLLECCLGSPKTWRVHKQSNFTHSFPWNFRKTNRADKKCLGRRYFFSPLFSSVPSLANIEIFTAPRRLAHHKQTVCPCALTSYHVMLILNLWLKLLHVLDVDILSKKSSSGGDKRWVYNLVKW